jgi:CHAT domain-containing protein
VQEALESGDFLHYAGHGRFAGADGFESELLLAGGSTLAVSDVLLLARTPTIAVLSGCELAKSDDASGESFGIAQALLSRGTSFAIAPSRTVKDELAERFVRALYKDGPFDEEQVAGRMHEALAELARDVPHEDWSTFRLLAR